MPDKYLEAGIIVNTHGVRGEVKIQPWADSPSFLVGFEHFYIDGSPVGVVSARVHKNCVIALFSGVSDFNGAIKLKNKRICIDRADAQVESGRRFVADLIGLRAVDAETGAEIGRVTDVLTLPANDVYVIGGHREILVPAVPDFVDEINTDMGFVRIHLREGL
jgi:16S rRNA processing protein RimM